MGVFSGYNLPRDIVMISTADWDASLWTNKQHIASRLTQDFRVVYVEPLKSIGQAKRGYNHRAWTDPKCGVHVFRPSVVIPFGNKLPSLNEINHYMISQPLRDYIRELGFDEYILWVYTPNGFPYLDILEPVLSCYDCVDEYSAFPGAWKTVTLQMEAKLIRDVDVVFTTAETLYESKRRNNPNTYFIPNVGDFDLFSRADVIEPARAIRMLRKKPVIGFVGALNYKIDEQLVRDLFVNHPDKNFVFIGPDRGFGVERYKYNNVHFMGLRPPEDLPKYMAGFDVCIIPYKVDNYTRGVMPIKFYEYLATGRPVVTTPIPELEKFSDLVEIARTSEEFSASIERALRNEDNERKAKRIELAKSNSWETRIRSILHHLEESYRQKLMNP